MRFYVVTGGPGVGKTSLIEALKLRGYKTVPEDARALIQKEMRENGVALPWKDKAKYAIRMLEEGIRSYRAVHALSTEKPVFFDRSVVDALCYAEMENLAVKAEMEEEIKNCVYQRMVFILPPWAEIYQTDAERKQSWPAAVRTFDYLKDTYIRLGYVLIEVPKGTIEERCHFMLQKIEI